MGAKTILVELSEKDKYNVDDLPSGKTIEHSFKSLSLTAFYEKHRPLCVYKPPKVEVCHDLWEIDDKGAEHYLGIGEVSMINIKDVKSGVIFIICLKPNIEKRSNLFLINHLLA
jgi:hypothetical protein